MTSNLYERMNHHKLKFMKGFASKYGCTQLLYYEAGSDIHSILERERQIKRYKREWKENLINSVNPPWRDLSEDFEF